MALSAGMGVGRWAVGSGGELTLRYVPLIASPFALLQLAVVHRMRVAERRGRPIGRAVYLATAVAWVCALGFGFTVPDVVDGQLVSIFSLLAGESQLSMSIALCNPFGIIAFAGIIAALIFSVVAGRDPRPSEDELLDAAEELAMVEHPLSR